MGRFYPLYIRRSDGKLETVSHAKRERNEPTSAQLDPKANAGGMLEFYRLVANDEPKHLDWRRKIGGMLARELGLKDSDDLSYILADFPENYRLYEHVKRAADIDKGGAKGHALGSQDRMDSYMYGHPHGRKKRFRSPNDFYNHALWLATDATGDPRNCTCKICSPTDIDEKALHGLQIKTEMKAIGGEKTNGDRPKTPMSASPSSASAAQRKPASSTITKPREPAPAEAGAAIKPASSNLVVVLPRSKSSMGTPTQPQSSSPSQAVRPRSNKDRDLAGAAIHRTGELVWFSRGQAWGLGVVLRRSHDSSNPRAQAGYVIQPLSHPYQHPLQVSLKGEDHLRPWLAWSVPALTSSMLNNINVTYTTADWNGIRNGAYGSGDPVVDGSILAAKAIDSSYSLYDPIPALGPDRYDGIYLGAERVWVGDLVRLASQNGRSNLLLITGIQKALSTDKNDLSLSGELYTSQQVRTSDTNDLLPGVTAASLPMRLQKDLEFRNNKTIPRQGFATVYRPAKSVKVSSRSVLGRWYETWPLLAILVGDEAQAMEEVASGSDVNTKLNRRFDCSKTSVDPAGASALETEAANRVAAFGRAVPTGTAIVEDEAA